MTYTALYPLAPKDELFKEYVGKSLKDVGAPAAVIDLSIVKENCQKMLDAVKELGFGWRAHIKTHKTTEITQLQVGSDTCNQANIVASTLIEAEEILPLLQTYPKRNLLYGLPPGPSSIPRLSYLSKVLGPSGLSLLIDHPAQLSVVRSIHESSSILPLIYIKIDMGGHRAGVPPFSAKSTDLFKAVVEAHKEGYCVLHGLYSHAGHSYGSTCETIAMDFLNQEFVALIQVADQITSFSNSEIKNLVLSVGATPTTTSVRNLLLPSTSNGTTSKQSEIVKATTNLRNTIKNITEKSHKIELHAGVYPTIDLQQIATSALPPSQLSEANIALTVLAEVLSIYPERKSALVGSGVLALGRESCPSYSGYGILTPWNLSSTATPKTNSNVFKNSKYKISYISQEHGLISPMVNERVEALEVGQKVRIWPNHACITSSGFGWYLVVDGGDEIVDVWVRFRGW